VTQSVCAECGEASPSGVQFCPACGHFMWSSAPAPEPPAEDPQAEQPPKEQRPAEQRPADVRPPDHRHAAAAASTDPAATAIIRERVPATPADDPTTITPLRKPTALPPKVTVPTATSSSRVPAGGMSSCS
jgi:uncharacterized Zn finger protein (UPF0148 family)